MHNQKFVKTTKTAKLDRKLFFEIGSGAINVTKSAMDYMLFTINYVARDGRIYCEAEKIRTSLNFQPKTMVRVLNELTALKLLSYKDGYYYSHYHVVTSGKKNEASYIRTLSIFKSGELLGLTKNQKRFFLYVASAGIINGSVQRVSIESLYNNSCNSGVNYIESYKDLASILTTLVNKGLIDVYIDQECFNYQSEDFEYNLHRYCEFNPITGKKRMEKSKKHIIGLRVHFNLAKEIIKNEANRYEIQHFAELNNIYHTLMHNDTFKFLADVQNELFDLFGETGIHLYRQALQNYFSDEKSNVLYHDLFLDENKPKTCNMLMDFYLLENVVDIITNVTSNKGDLTEIDTFFADNDNLINLVTYFNEKSSDNHKVKLDESLEVNGVNLAELVKSINKNTTFENCWLQLQERIKPLYQLLDYDAALISKDAQKRVIRQCAKEGILMRKEILKQVVNTLDKKITFLPIKSVPSYENRTIDTKLQSTYAPTDDANKETKAATIAKPNNKHTKKEKIVYGF